MNETLIRRQDGGRVLFFAVLKCSPKTSFFFLSKISFRGSRPFHGTKNSVSFIVRVVVDGCEL